MAYRSNENRRRAACSELFAEPDPIGLLFSASL